MLKTDVELYGGFDFQTFAQKPKWLIATELEQQYRVENVDAEKDYPELPLAAEEFHIRIELADGIHDVKLDRGQIDGIAVRDVRPGAVHPEHAVGADDGAHPAAGALPLP